MARPGVEGEFVSCNKVTQWAVVMPVEVEDDGRIELGLQKHEEDESEDISNIFCREVGSNREGPGG